MNVYICEIKCLHRSNSDKHMCVVKSVLQDINVPVVYINLNTAGCIIFIKLLLSNQLGETHLK